MTVTTNLITYTTNGTYSTPSVGAFRIRVLARGAGGGGTSGVTHTSTATTRKAGSGGGGGAVTPPPKLLRVADLALPLTVTVGVGGAGGQGSLTNGGWNPGGNGSLSSITDADGGLIVRAYGGLGAPDWQIGGPGGSDGAALFAGGVGATNGGPGGWANAVPIQSVSGGGGGGGGGGYNAANNPIPADGINGMGGQAGITPGPTLGAGNGYSPSFYQWNASGTGGAGGNYSTATAGNGGVGGFPAGGGGGGGGGSPGGWGGNGSNGLVTIIEYIKE